MSNSNIKGRPAMFTKEEDKYILEHYLTDTSTEIGIKLGYSPKQIQARAKRLGMRKKPNF